MVLFLSSLKPLDVEFMKAIHSKVNIVPVIAKADTLTLRERDRLKRRVSVIQTVQCLAWTSDVFLLSAIVVCGCLINWYSNQNIANLTYKYSQIMFII